MEKNFLRILSFFILPAIVFVLSNFVDIFTNAFEMISWLDKLFHFIGGASAGYMFFLFFKFWEEKKLIKINNKLVLIFFIVSAVGFIAILWEFYEFLMVSYLGVNWNINYEDTLGDLFFGLLGGLFTGVFSKV